MYPINLNIKDKKCVVIGGGKVALRKVMGLLDEGANIVVVAPNIIGELQNLVAEKKIQWKKKNYEKTDKILKNALLVFCATDNIEVNKMVAEEAKKFGALVNSATHPKELGDFYVPSRIKRGDLLLTVSTNGKSPALSKIIRQELDNIYGKEFLMVVKVFERLRVSLRENVKDINERARIWNSIQGEEILKKIRNGDDISWGDISYEG